MTRYLPANPQREASERARMRADPATLCAESRKLVLLAIRRVCAYEEWALHAAHVRTNHVHLALTVDDTGPEAVMGKLKAYASRALNERFGRRTKRWARHGSTVWVWDDEQLQQVIRYTVHGQGAPMAVYKAKWIPTEPRA